MFSTAALICSEDGLTTTGGKESNEFVGIVRENILNESKSFDIEKISFNN